MQLVGQATIRRIIRNAPQKIWEDLNDQLGCTREAFDQYAQSTEEIYALELDEVTPFRVPLSRKEAISILKESLSPPQSYCAVGKTKSWGKALSLVSFLQGAFSGRILTLFDGLLNDNKEEKKYTKALEFQMRRIVS